MPGIAFFANAADVCIAGRFFVHCLFPMAGHSRHRFRMVESTLGYWDPASADWRICSTAFEPRQWAADVARIGAWTRGPAG
jgi:hypothetical protein